MLTHARPVRRCAFGPIVVEYDDRVLTPRAWTLEQSRWAAEIARSQATTAPLLELCAGAGHIGLAAAVLADRDLVQVELDPVAAEFARANAARAGRQADVRLAPLESALAPGETYPLIIADPPYLPSSVVARWPDDPTLAIDGGPDGLRLIRCCLDVATGHLTASGCLLLQVAGPAQAAEIERMLDSTPAAQLQASDLRVIDDERAVLRIDRIDRNRST